MSAFSLLFGRRLANDEAEVTKLTAIDGVPAMGLDGLGSAAYGPEAALTILMPVGAAGLGLVQPITWVILLLLAILFFSYWQTIMAYPSNGGAYTVARENLGPGASLLAGTALMIDYMLNVAVGISAGIGALTSAIPAAQPYTLALCLAVLVIVTAVNLRGTRESGMVFAIPTYGFILTLGLVIVWGAAKTLAAGGHPHPVVPPPPIPASTEAIGLWLVLRAFAAGCTAMTGVEAVSNGVGAFRAPTVKYAHRTLAIIVLTLGALLFGIAFLAQSYRLTAMDQTAPGYRSILAQLTGAVAGEGWLYYVTLVCVLAVLCLSANTSFVGFPRLCRLVAEDGYLPRAFALPGRRLVFSTGIGFLAAGTGLLLVVFDGITDRLIPLFAVGAFLSFTLSQAGMAQHWRQALRQEGQGAGTRSAHRLRFAINGLGALATGLALLIILAAKFVEGAWITVVAIPLTLWLLRSIRRHYDRIEAKLMEGCDRPLDLTRHGAPVILIPLERWTMLAARSVRQALCLSPDVVALHLTYLAGPDAQEHLAELRRQWRTFVEQPAAAAGFTRPRLIFAASPFRSVLAPILRAVRAVRAQQPDRQIMVMVPELVPARWWERILHTSRARRLRASLLRYGNGVTVLSVPWATQYVTADRILEAEEPDIKDHIGHQGMLKQAAAPG